MAKVIYVAADLSNLYHCIRKTFGGAKLDFGKLLGWIGDHGEIIEAVAYGSQVKNEAQRFIHCLHKLGWNTKYKRTRTYESSKRKANWDVGISMDIVRMIESSEVNTVVLCSADGDFKELVEYCTLHEVETIILACGISGDLKATATTVIEIPESLLENKDELTESTNTE